MAHAAGTFLRACVKSNAIVINVVLAVFNMIPLRHGDKPAR